VTRFQTLSGKEEYTVNPTLEMLAATKEIHFQEQEEAENATSKTKESFMSKRKQKWHFHTEEKMHNNND
jgi:hypothetical protein